MNLAVFIDALEKAASKYLLKLRILIKTDNAVKARIEISGTVYIQFYFNQASNTSNFVLVGWDKRLYGRDSVGGNWHRHPFGDSKVHDITSDGAKVVTPEEFLDEIFEILLREKLI